MISISILLAGTERGPFSEETVRQQLQEGLLQPSDPARLKEQDPWKPLKEVLDSLPPQPVPDRMKRIKKRTSSRALQARRRKQLLIGGCIIAALILILCFIFQDYLTVCIYIINDMLYEEWQSISL